MIQTRHHARKSVIKEQRWLIFTAEPSKAREVNMQHLPVDLPRSPLAGVGSVLVHCWFQRGGLVIHTRPEKRGTTFGA